MGSMGSLMAYLQEAYAKGPLPGLLLSVAHPHCEPLLTLASTGHPSTLAGGFVSVSCGVTAPFLWVLVHARCCLCPPRLESASLGPVEII